MKKLSLFLAALVGGAAGAGASLLLKARAQQPEAQVAVTAPAPAPVHVEVGDSPVLGPKNAPVTIVVWADFQCRFCARAEPALAELRKSYGDKINLVWKNQPLSGHEQALPAAQAAMAAHEQGKFWEYHDKLLANQARLGPDLYEETARELGLDLGRFREAAQSVRTRNKVVDDARQGSSLGAHGTPTFFVNGRMLVGAQPVETFRTAVDEALSARSP